MISAFILLIAAIFSSFTTLTYGSAFEWPTAFLNIDFAQQPASSFDLFSPKQITPSDYHTYTSDQIQLNQYKDNVWASKQLTYTLDLSNSTYDSIDLKLGFAEVFQEVCKTGGRVFQVYINTQKITTLDVYEVAGCFKAHDLVFVGLPTNQPIKISLIALIQNPMISNIQVRSARYGSSSVFKPSLDTTASTTKPTTKLDQTTTSDSTTAPSLSTSTVRQSSSSDVIDASKSAVIIDAGADDSIPTTTVFTDKSAKITDTIRPDAYTTARQGSEFTYKFTAKGVYAIQLGFAEINPDYCDTTDKRVFSVSLNDEKPKALQNLDIKAKVGCNKAYIWNSGDFDVGGELSIKFSASSGLAMISSIVVRKLVRNCVPESTAESIPTDHLSHAVPGSYPPQTSKLNYIPDLDDNGYEIVKIDGTGSHSHYFDVKGGITGKVIDFEWLGGKANEFLSDKASFTHKFFLGVTNLNLKVVDNVCDSNAAETTVTVEKPGASEPDAPTPTIKDLQPIEASTEGEGFASVKIENVRADLKPKSISIMGKEVEVTKFDPGQAKIEFTIPAAKVIETVDLFVNWEDGTKSNVLTLTYVAKKMTEPIIFTEQAMKEDTTELNNGISTSIKIGADGNIYLGTLNAVVIRLVYDMDSLVVTSRCQSKPIRDPKFKDSKGNLSQRDILGLAFDPRDKFPRPYVSTSILFWPKRIDPDNTAAWRNGAIDRLAQGSDPSDPSICLVYDKRIVSNLPVSNRDHGVNGIEFTQNGDLLINIGGSTNMGLPGAGLGGLWDTPNQGNTLLAKLSKGATFNGEITYSQDEEPHLGKQTGGDVQLVAEGLRNPYGIVLHSSGRLYSTDNGPNAGFGNVSVSCDDADIGLKPGETPPKEWPGNVKISTGKNEYSVSRPDKVVHIDLGKVGFFGHPNFQRGQCRYIDPIDDKDVLDADPPANYVTPIALIQSSASSIFEYHAEAVFGDALKDQLIVSKYKSGFTKYLPPNKAGSPRFDPIQISTIGGLSGTMNARGDMLINQIQDKKIIVLRPKVPVLESLERMTIIAATPYRHGAQGGTKVTIGGFNFGTDPVTVKIGGKNCPVLSQSNTMVTCTVPKAELPGSVVNMDITSEGMMRAKMNKAIWYMSV